MKLNKILYLLLLFPVLVSCTGKNADTCRPNFSSDSAYSYIEAQMAFGPRVPNGIGHTRCANYLLQQLDAAGANITLQKGEKTDYSGREQQVINIIGHFGGYDRPAILLCAHYDTRPWSDEEQDYEARYYNVPGANDGASGVGVLLEVARQLGLILADTASGGLKVPVEIAFFDCEDMGTPNFYTGVQRENTWCLGSQLWAERCTDSSRYRFGILLDMVGAPDAVFPREYYSEQYAPNQVEKVWRAAASLGYSRYFSSAKSYPITDDHVYVNAIGIPCVDIIHYDASNASGFPYWWHTRGDDMQQISKSTLQAVGETVMAVIL